MAKPSQKKATEKPNRTQSKTLKYIAPVLNRPLICALLLTTIFFGMQMMFFESSYQTNDDIGMTFVVSGTGTSPVPDEHMRFSHVALGFLLKALYTMSPDVPWYGLYHMLVHFLASAALLYALIHQGVTIRRIAMFGMFFFAVELAFLNELQFTVTGFVAAQNGIILFLAALDEQSKKSRPMTVAAFLLILTGCMVRSSSCYLAILLTAPVAVVFAFSHRHDRNYLLRAGMMAMITLASIAALSWTDKAHYNNDPAWRDFFEINTLKSRFIDWQHAMYNDDTKAVFDEVGWSQNDFYMLLSWFFADEDVYSKENLARVLDHFPAFRSHLDFSAVMAKTKKSFSGGAHILVLAAFFALMAAGSRRNLSTIAGTGALVLLLMVFLIYTKRLPDRVAHPMFSYAAVMGLYLAGKTAPPKSYWYRLTLAIAAGALLIWVAGNVVSEHGKTTLKQEANSRFRSTIEKLSPTSDQLYVVWGAALPYEHMLPFDNTRYIRDFKLISLGTTLRTPITKERMREFDIDDIYRAIYENDNVYLVINNLRYLYFYSQYVLEHYGKELKYAYVFQSKEFTVVTAFDETHPGYNVDVEEKKVVNPYKQ